MDEKLKLTEPQRIFLEGFKASHELYNGEYPDKTDKELWDRLKDSFDKFKQEWK